MRSAEYKKEILKMKETGATDYSIAKFLGITPTTVKMRYDNKYKKQRDEASRIYGRALQLLRAKYETDFIEIHEALKGKLF